MEGGACSVETWFGKLYSGKRPHKKLAPSRVSTTYEMNLDQFLSTLESPIVLRPTRRMTQGELESYLDKAADILRGNADHSEFRGYVFALLFYKRISDCFDEEVRTQAATLTKAGVPPVSNGDWAWMQQIVKSLKDADPDTGTGGRGMVVMSQGVLFRGQPEQTEEEDGQNQKADVEYVIRRGVIEADLIKAIVVLPGKLFYGNNVPGCLVLLNKAKPGA